MGNVTEISASNKYRTHSFDKVTHGIYVGSEIGKRRHGTCGSEQTRQQKQYNNKEPHHKYGLLHVVGVVRNDESER